jgi:hypothetical protein
MAWDASRPIPWKQIIRDWVIFVALMTIVLLIWSRNRLDASLLGGVLASGPIYVVIAVLLAKLGYRRKTLAELRSETERRAAEKRPVAAPPTTGRARPAPTRRTGGSAAGRPGGSTRRPKR